MRYMPHFGLQSRQLVCFSIIVHNLAAFLALSFYFGVSYGSIMPLYAAMSRGYFRDT
jgi:hypothetical protein